MRRLFLLPAVAGLFALLGFALLALGPAAAADIYAQPVGAVPIAAPTGSIDAPFNTAVAAIKAAKGGDTVYLLDGDHGEIKLDNRLPASQVVVTSLNDKKAHVTRIALERKTGNLTFRNLSVWRNPGDPSRADRISAPGTTSSIVLDGLDVRGDADVSNYPSWTKAEWASRNMKGFTGTSPGLIVRNSTFTGLGFAIVLDGKGQIFENNVVRGFSMDGIRALADDLTIRGNLVTDCVEIDSNHGDMIQSWSRDGKPVVGMVIDGNRLLEWTNSIAPALRCGIQGIGFFDGWFDDLTITNNVISVGAYHGLSVYGGRDVKILNNTVVSNPPANKGNSRAWLGVFNHKNGKPSTDVVVANNVVPTLKVTASEANRVVVASNTVAPNPVAVFRDPINWDFRPLAGSALIDSGDPALAPAEDIIGTFRPAGAAPERGAYEQTCILQ